MRMGKKKITRRSFVLLAGATGVAALMIRPGMQISEKLIPYINPPAYPEPGDWAFFSTACRECPAGCGMLMWHRDGRATKAEGNPLHPVNKGKLCIRGQSSVQGEYEPERLTGFLEKKLKGGWIENSWDLVLPAIKKVLQFKKPILLSGLETGSLAGIMEDFAAAYSTKPLYYEAFNYESLRIASGETYGRDVIPYFDINGSDLILSFNADFLQTWLSPVEYAGDFSKMHSPESRLPGRFVYFGYSENLTAVNADDFILTAPGTHSHIIYSIALKLLKKGAVRNKDLMSIPDEGFATGQPGLDDSAIETITERIINARSPVILAGRGDDSSIDGVNTVKAAFLLNEMLGNRERIDFSRYHALSGAMYKKDFHALLKSITTDNVLIINNTNPVYSDPGSEEYIKRASAVIYIGPFKNETSALANWILPSHYYLEDWGDFEPWKGTISLMQPVMKPLYDTMSAGEIFMDLTAEKKEKVTFREVTEGNWKKWLSDIPGDFDDVVRSSHIRIKQEPSDLHFSPSQPVSGSPVRMEGNELYFDPLPSLYFYDGRMANRPWLQEIPDPVSNIAWQSRIDISPGSASALNLRDGEVVRITSGAGSVEGAIRITEKISDKVISIETGQGHWSSGETADGRGINAFTLSAYDYPGPLPSVKIEGTGKINMPLYLNYTQEQHGRELLRYVKDGSDKRERREEITMPLPEGYSREKDLYKPHYHKNHRWAMAIDLQKCIGCHSCVAACYAENNVPVMGRENCKRGLEMAWLKVPAYRIEESRIAFIPLPCQHCDAAPCEPVCPVFASAHTDEGLNAQIYNRCVGTRYCSNNCPYKVRRFNWKNIEHPWPGNLQLNPEVTVRSRGVMEKCTFCVQRIRNAEYAAKKEGRQLEDGAITPACAQTCPTGAIIFGDLFDPGSKVSGLFIHERRYQLLHELNTKPGVVYLKKIIL